MIFKVTITYDGGFVQVQYETAKSFQEINETFSGDHISIERLYTLENIKDGYEDAYYEGAGDDAWYRDHKDQESNLNADAWVRRPMNEFIEHLNKDEENG